MDGSGTNNPPPPEAQPNYPPAAEDPYHPHRVAAVGTAPAAPALPPPHQQVHQQPAPVPALPVHPHHGHPPPTSYAMQGHAHQAPAAPPGAPLPPVPVGGGGRGAMSALTAAAAAAQPATPTSSSSSALPPISSSIHHPLPLGGGLPPGSLLPLPGQQHQQPQPAGFPGAHPHVVSHSQHSHPHHASLPPNPNSNIPSSYTSKIQMPNPKPHAGGTLLQSSSSSHSQSQSAIGKVVESGHEHTGRWTKEEHESFLAALQLYGKEWKKVAARVKTRTVVQTRTHAQKYFQKLQKVLEAGGDKEANTVIGIVGGSGITLSGSSPTALAHANIAAMMDLGVPNSSEKKAARKSRARTSISQKQQRLQPQPLLAQQHYPPPHPPEHYPPPHPPPPPVSGHTMGISRSNSATAAALLNMSNDRRLSATSIGPGPPGLGSTTAGAYSAHTVPGAPPPVSQQQHGFSTSVNQPAAGLSNAPPAGASASSAHGFGFPPPTASTGATAAKPPIGSTGISIVAPPHEDAAKAGKFPEPSPAACGKRKMAEIAAAQMLAGVVGAAVAKQGALAATGTGEPAPKRRASVTGSAAIQSEGTAAMPAAHSYTAPSYPESSYPEISYPDDPAVLGEEGVETQPHPPLPDGGAPAEQAANSVLGLALQIVNPDTLANQGNVSAKRRLINGQASPMTPWDGQLAALVSQVKSQEPAPPADPNAANADLTATNEDLAELMAAVEESESLPIPLPLQHPRTTLQQAVCNGSVNEVSQICTDLTPENSGIVLEWDEAGFYPLHSAAALGLVDHFGPQSGEATEICQLLIDAGADVMCRDAHGNTPLHWAARAGHGDVLGLILLKSGGATLDVPNDAGESALHWAMRTGERGMGAVKVLVENGARVNVFNRNFRRPLDVAAEGFDSLEEGENSTQNDNALTTQVDQRIRRSTRWNLMHFSSQCRTLVLHHNECLDHLAKSDHDWEVPDRIGNIMSTIQTRTTESCLPENEANFQPHELTISNEFERATLELLSRIHSAEYLAFVNDLSKELERKRKQQRIEEAESNWSGAVDGQETDSSAVRDVVPFTPNVQRKVMKEAKAKEDSNSDTAFSAGSLKAARRAAGAVQHAVDCVLVGRNRNAFCIVRPPGHHAGINGLLSDAESCGFCLFNNVAAGAMHALSDEKHRPRCERCAIVDIDAHHGNGTEEIVRKCHDSGRLLFFSVHLYDHDKPKKGQDFQYKFYPGTGAEDDVAHNVINVPIAPLWREKEVVKSTSLASNGGASAVGPRQTRQRSREDAKRVPSVPDLAKCNAEETPQAASLEPNSVVASVESVSMASDSSQSAKPRPPLPTASPHYPPHYLMGVGRLAYRRAIQHRLLPALRAFNPDLIILSTGFDAARGDVGNARHYVNGTEAMGLDLEPEDYAWTARKVCEVADICCDGRVVSVLEGGYGRTPPPVPAPPVFAGDPAVEASTEPVKQKLDKSFFSECAVQHLKGLVDPYYSGEDEQQKDSSNRKQP